MLPISVVMITYNHEKYIGEAIQSILDQTFKDFEFIIVNDGSTDKTEEVIKSFSDDRITYIYQKNQGPSAAANSGILAAKGNYIALMSGDDVCYLNRLERQYEHICQSGYKIVFCWVDVIDEESQLKPYEYCRYHFNRLNSSRAEILNRFFTQGNWFCAPSAVFKRDICLEEGLFCLTSIQIQDFDMWLKFVKKYDIFVLPERLLKYRWQFEGRDNLSGDLNDLRSEFELFEFYKCFFDGVSIELFKEAFSGNLRNPNFESEVEYELEKSFLYLSHGFTCIHIIGASHLYRLLQNRSTLAVSEEKYGFGLRELFNMNKNHALFKSQHEVYKLQGEISGMRASRFWKLREQLVKLRSISL